MFYRVASLFIRLVMFLLSRLEVTGLENVPRHGSLLIASNHINFIDPVLLGAVLPRRIVFMAKIELFNIWWFAPIAQAYGAFSIRRGEGDTQAIRQAISVASSGQVLGVFPEGHRSDTGELIFARPGVGLIALRSGAPILPVGIVGTRAFLSWPAILSRSRVEVRIGQPYTPSRTPSLSSREQQALVTDDLMRRIAALLPPEQRGEYQLNMADRPTLVTGSQRSAASPQTESRPDDREPNDYQPADSVGRKG